MRVHTRLIRTNDRPDVGGEVYAFQIKTLAAVNWLTAGELVVVPHPDNMYHVTWLPGALAGATEFQTSILDREQYEELLTRLQMMVQVACPSPTPLPSPSNRL